MVFRSTGVADEWELTGAANVEEVLAWAASNSRGREMTVHVVADHPGAAGQGAFRLIGPAEPEIGQDWVTSFLTT